MRKIIKLLGVVVVLLAIGAGAIWWGGWGSISATHPSLASQKLAPLIPIRDFFANSANKWGYMPSPKGKWLSWWEATNSGSVIRYKRADGSGDVGTITAVQGASYVWDFGDRHILLSQRENDRKALWKIDLEKPDADWQEVTPRGFKSWRIIYRPRDPDERWLISSNDREAKLVDMYSVEPDGLGKKLIERNPGNVTSFSADRSGNIVMRTVKTGEDTFQLEYRKKPEMKEWKAVLSYTALDIFQTVVLPNNGHVQAISNIGRDKIALVDIDLATGVETIVAANDEKSIRHVYSLTEHALEVDVVNFGNGYPEYEAITDRGRNLLAAMEGQQAPFIFGLLGKTLDGNKVTLSISEQENSWHYKQVDIESGEQTALGQFDFSRHAEYLAETKALKVKARDGLDIPVLLTLPFGIKPEKLPMIVWVHGGPALNDRWGYNHLKQFMANRGYAVLSVNYRGSTGFGKAFQKAGFLQFGRAMQDDIIDAAKWAISEGIADAEKIAIYGASFGGYSAMMGVGRDPDFFVAGISVVGVTDLEYQSRFSPFTWGLRQAYVTRYFGSIDNADDLKELRDNSPINMVDNIKVPVLLAHGINDPTVDRAQSEVFERKLKERDVDYEAYYYEKEGHGFRRWQTKIMFYRKLEDFLARNLGGRSGGFDYTELGARYLN